MAQLLNKTKNVALQRVSVSLRHNLLKVPKIPKNIHLGNESALIQEKITVLLFTFGTVITAYCFLCVCGHLSFRGYFQLRHSLLKANCHPL